MNVWRSQVERRGTELVAVIGARSWSASAQREAKRQAVVDILSDEAGRAIRVVVLEERIPGDRHVSAARCDDQLWLVEDTGSDFLLWRARAATNVTTAPLADPVSFGKLTPARRAVTSERIERDPRVRRITLERARNQCEVPGCGISMDYRSMDVHHITALGDRGADHTDNTVALCPACHSRIHRGVPSVQTRLKRIVKRVRADRL
jgi:hypothetical protein